MTQVRKARERERADVGGKTHSELNPPLPSLPPPLCDQWKGGAQRRTGKERDTISEGQSTT